MTALIAATILALATLMPARHVPDRPPLAVTTRIAASPSRHHIRGGASWFASPANVSAAGPLLRRAIGPRWRGTRVLVCSSGRCVPTVLGDWCACPGSRIIDLDDNVFARLAPLSRGVREVTVTW
jgi:hypothetical protein